MSKCIYCHDRKGKRPCPPLNGSICTLCCGENRLKNISCPDTCQYLFGDKKYHQKKIDGVFDGYLEETRQIIYHQWGDGGMYILNLINLAAYYFNAIEKRLSDYDLQKGLECMIRDFSVIKLPDFIKSDFGDFLIKFIGDRKEDFGNSFSGNDHIVDISKEYIKLIKEISGEKLQSTQYMEFLLRNIDKNFPRTSETIKKGDTGAMKEPLIVTP
ncbi:MAG: hypothetical protein HY578_06025 [Nitrospinae bacterium]|nr:hypothetical protein [Nitrospinota bacterium]